MIQANELRIGNYVLVADLMLNKPMPAKITMIGSRVQVDSHYTELYHNYNAIGPIPLTPEILEKAGFALISQGEYYACYEKEDISIAKDGQGYYACWADAGRESSISIIGKPFQYVHQLQNLYYALTGEELKINLTNVPAHPL